MLKIQGAIVTLKIINNNKNILITVLRVHIPLVLSMWLR